LPNGQISNSLGGKCIGADGDAVNLVGCDGGSTWEMQGNGFRILKKGLFPNVSFASLSLNRPIEAGTCRGILFESEGICSWG